MKKTAITLVILIILSSCGSSSKLIVKNGTQSNFQIHLSPHKKMQYGGYYTVIHGQEIIIGEYKNGDYRYTTIPHTFVRIRNTVKDSVVYQNGQPSGKLSITILDSLKIEPRVLDSIFINILHHSQQKHPKEIIWTIQDAFFDKEGIKGIKGMNISSQRLIHQEGIKD